MKRSPRSSPRPLDPHTHLVGSAASQASPREFFRQKRGGKAICKELDSPFWRDGMNELQVRERSSSTTDQLITEWTTVSAKALKSRTKMPRPIAGLKLLTLPEPVGRQPLSYLFDIGFTRDVWAHRIDIAHAIAVEPDHDAVHDGRILAESSPNGRPPTASRSLSSSAVPPAAPSCRGSAVRKSTSASSISFAPSQSGPPQAAFSNTPFHSDFPIRNRRSTPLDHLRARRGRGSDDGIVRVALASSTPLADGSGLRTCPQRRLAAIRTGSYLCSIRV